MARKKQRRRVPTRTLALTLGVATLAAGGTLVATAAALSPVPLIDNRPAASGGTLTFAWDPPVASKPRKAPTLATLTPADQALTAAVGNGTFSGYDAKTKAESTIYGGPYAGSCKTLLNPAPLAGTMRRARDGTAALAVTAWAYPAGGAAAAVQHAATTLASCDAPSDARPTMTSLPTPAGNGFVVTSPNGGDGVAWMVWSRGDIVLAVVGTSTKGQGPTSRVRTLADKVDASTRAALASTCADTTSPAADISRNPYLGKYRPYSYTSGLRVPGVSVAAPEYKAPKADDLGEVVVPQARPAEDLAPVLVPDDLADGDVVPDLEQAQRGDAPVLVNPDDIPVPDGVLSEEPTPPGEVAPADGLKNFAVLSPDRTGPGCGWEFTGTKAPNVSAKQLAASTRKHAEKAFWSLAVSQADAKLKAAEASAQSATYGAELRRWELYVDYQRQVDAARAARAAAVVAYETSVSAYEDFAERWAEQLEETEPVEPVEPSEPAPSTPAPSLPEPTEPTETAPTLPTDPEVLG